MKRERLNTVKQSRHTHNPKTYKRHHQQQQRQQQRRRKMETATEDVTISYLLKEKNMNGNSTG